MWQFTAFSVLAGSPVVSRQPCHHLKSGLPFPTPQGEAALSASLQEEARLRALVRQLEDDLLRSSGVNSMTADVPAPSSSLPADVHPPGTPDSGNEAPSAGGGAGEAGGASGGLLEIVVGQRDRFRQRALQLEEEKGERWVVGGGWGHVSEGAKVAARLPPQGTSPTLV